ncbi:hypothetical protein ACWY4P_53150 [Streptomyces sp. LZ34]
MNHAQPQPGIPEPSSTAAMLLNDRGEYLTCLGTAEAIRARQVMVLGAAPMPADAGTRQTGTVPGGRA